MDPVTVTGDAIVPGSITHQLTDTPLQAGQDREKWLASAPFSADRVTVNGKKILLGKMKDLHKWLNQYGVSDCTGDIPGDPRPMSNDYLVSDEEWEDQKRIQQLGMPITTARDQYEKDISDWDNRNPCKIFRYTPGVWGKGIPPEHVLKNPADKRFADAGWHRSDGVSYFAILVPIGCGGFYVPGIEIEPGVPLIVYNDNYIQKSQTRPGMDVYNTNNDYTMIVFVDKSDIKNMPDISGCEAGKKYQEDRKPKQEPTEQVSVSEEDEGMAWPGYDSPFKTQWCERFPDDERCHPDSIANVKGQINLEDDEDTDIEFDDYDSPLTGDFCERFPDHPLCND